MELMLVTNTSVKQSVNTWFWKFKGSLILLRYAIQGLDLAEVFKCD